MPYKNLTHFISALEDSDELIRINEFVSPHLEITEVTDRISKHNGPALLFENTGTDFPLLINAFGSEKRICMALGLNNLDDVGKDIEEIMKAFMSPKDRLIDKVKVLPILRELASWIPKTRKGKGSCQEIVMNEPDLSKLPVLTCWPADGGPFITLPCVHTIDPGSGIRDPRSHITNHESRIRNLGMYRMQVFGPDLTGMHWHLHKGSANHYLKYKKLGMRMPVSVTLGGDPVYTYVATAPLPENLDEYLLAGFLRKKKVELVKCLTNDLEVPADADFVIEGYVDPQEELIQEGPFGDHTGFYSLADQFPSFHVTCITHRKGAIYPATIVGIPPQEDGWIGKATERIFITPLKMSVVPELTDMHMPLEGVFHNIVLSSIDKTYPGQAEKVMNALWGAGQMMFNKIMVVTDPDVKLTDYRAVGRAISRHVDPLQDILFSKGPLDILDHSSTEYASGSKIGLDATKKLPGKDRNTSSETAGTVDREKLVAMLPEIVEINDSLLKEEISVLIVTFKKTDKGQTRNLAQKLVDNKIILNTRFVVLMDEFVNPEELSTVVWLGANNIDPLRDCFYVDHEGKLFPCLFIDATRKTGKLDDFKREWPNVIVMDHETILMVDKKWPALGLGPNIPSPSTQYKSLVFKDGPIS
ncbi:MAG: menaquinone biosynthesis decarboxylase [Bacteroidales bacterium]|nr:menaquinone biosynthesis decarboxylase [Bacteroidales bacterium]